MTVIDVSTHRRQEAAAQAPAAAASRAWALHEKIDICRGLFAVLVVVAHAQEIAFGVHPGAAEGPNTWPNWIATTVFGSGMYYVMGFFVLSGYCIHLSVARSMKADHFPVQRYMAARLTRIMPLYYIGLFLTLAVEWLIHDARPREWPHGLDGPTFLGQLFMVQNLYETFGSFASSWSITNEVFYYVLYGVLAWRLAGRGSEARPAWVGLGLCVAVAIVGQTLYVTVGRNPYVYRTGMLFGLGMIWFQGALVAIHGPALMTNVWVRRVASLWPGFLVAAILWRGGHLPPQGTYLLSGWAFTLMMLDFLRSPTVDPPADAGRIRSGCVRTLGLASYPLYLFHGPLLMLAGSWIMRTNAITDWRITWALLSVLGLTSGVLLGWFLERPVMNWRSALLKQMKG